MSDYRRLISYIYEYEGKEKGKNVGFVKLEARNGQCRLNLSVKKVYMRSSAIGVFLLYFQHLSKISIHCFNRMINLHWRIKMR